MEIKYHAQFLLDKEKEKPDAKLRYRVKWSGNIVAFNIGYRIEIDKWSTETQRCKANTTHGHKKIPASIINRQIQEFESACQRTFQKFEVDVISPCSKQQMICFKEIWRSFIRCLTCVESLILLVSLANSLSFRLA